MRIYQPMEILYNFLEQGMIYLPETESFICSLWTLHSREDLRGKTASNRLNIAMPVAGTQKLWLVTVDEIPGAGYARKERHEHLAKL